VAPPPTTPGHWLRAVKLRVIASSFDNRFGGWMDCEALTARGVTVVDTSRDMTLNLVRDIRAAMALVQEGDGRSQCGSGTSRGLPLAT
jgi:hypothetical protein